jgi:hypothetical protein
MNKIYYALFEVFIFLKDYFEYIARKMDDLAVWFYERTDTK